MAEWDDGYALKNDGTIRYHSIYCTECENIIKGTPGQLEEFKKTFNFCPYCGEKIDRKEVKL